MHAISCIAGNMPAIIKNGLRGGKAEETQVDAGVGALSMYQTVQDAGARLGFFTICPFRSFVRMDSSKSMNANSRIDDSRTNMTETIEIS